MNTAGFKTHNDRFSLLNLEAQYEFKTESSISFLLGKGPQSFFKVYGRVEVHHPCHGNFKSRLRVWLAPEYINESNMMQIIKSVLSELQINSNDSCETLFFEAGYKRFHIVNWSVVSVVEEFMHRS